MIWEASMSAAAVERLVKGAAKGAALVVRADVSEMDAQISVYRSDKPKAMQATDPKRIA